MYKSAHLNCRFPAFSFQDSCIPCGQNVERCLIQKITGSLDWPSDLRCFLPLWLVSSIYPLAQTPGVSTLIYHHELLVNSLVFNWLLVFLPAFCHLTVKRRVHAVLLFGPVAGKIPIIRLEYQIGHPYSVLLVRQGDTAFIFIKPRDVN